jgi:hypothetical protein
MVTIKGTRAGREAWYLYFTACCAVTVTASNANDDSVYCVPSPWIKSKGVRDAARVGVRVRTRYQL